MAQTSTEHGADNNDCFLVTARTTAARSISATLSPKLFLICEPCACSASSAESVGTASEPTLHGPLRFSRGGCITIRRGSLVVPTDHPPNASPFSTSFHPRGC